MLITATKIVAVNAANAKYCGGVPAMERESERIEKTAAVRIEPRRMTTGDRRVIRDRRRSAG
jgi:hypothetical protein